MKIPRFLSIAVVMTLVSLLYVYQQTEIFRLAYVGQKRQALLDDLLDKNTLLRYNIERQSSVVHIGEKLSASADFQMPDAYRFVRVPTAPVVSSAEAAASETLLSKIFGPKRQAEARPVSE